MYYNQSSVFVWYRSDIHVGSHRSLLSRLQGERMSHAVGCAFAICLEKKQKRERETVSVTFNDKGTTFTRMGSFRQATLTERMADPQSTIIPGDHSLHRPHELLCSRVF